MAETKSATEALKEAFRQAYRRYQSASQALALAQKDLLVATSASAEIFRSSRSGAGEAGADDWDGEKAHRAAQTIRSLGKHYELVAGSLAHQAQTLERVTEMAGMVLAALKESSSDLEAKS